MTIASLGTKSSAWLSQLNDVLLNAHAKVDGRKAALSDAYVRIMELFLEVRSEKRRVWWVGNGGSAALCAHLSQDAFNKLGLRSQVLADAPLLTCMANDFGYPQIYARPLSVLADSGDLLIAVSSSGRSENILNCVKLAQGVGMRVVSVSGFSAENPLWLSQADVSLFLDSTLYGLVEVGHEALLHAPIETLWLHEQSKK